MAVFMVTLRWTEVEPHLFKTLAGVAAGTGIAVLATNVLTWLWGV
jgi:type IV secretion system protein VirB2